MTPAQAHLMADLRAKYEAAGLAVDVGSRPIISIVREALKAHESLSATDVEALRSWLQQMSLDAMAAADSLEAVVGARSPL